MSTTTSPEPAQDTPPRDFDYEQAEGLHPGGEGPGAPVRPAPAGERNWREWMTVAVGLTSLLAVLAIGFSIISISDQTVSPAASPAGGAGSAGSAASGASVATAPAPTLAQAKGIAYERFQPVNPQVPAVPSGPVKKFTVSVIQHIVQVSPGLAPVEAWSYTVNGLAYRGTAASPPMVVNQGDRVQVTFINGTKADGVNLSHSIDIHAAEIAPNLNYVDVAPGQKKVISFTAKYAGVFMYHCATQPVLMHTGAGMTGMFLVKPRPLPPVAKELWLVQGEYYIGKPGGLADEAKMQAEAPDVLAFNGYANQYKYAPIGVPVGKPIRLYVLNAGPSKWSAFHVIGDLFDTVDEEGVVSHGAQTVSLAPAQGAWMDLTLPQTGDYTFVTHAFGDMVKGAAGVLRTPGAPMPQVTGPTPTGGSAKPVLPTEQMASGGTGGTGGTGGPSAAGLPAGTVAAAMGDLWIRSSTTSVKAGKITFKVTNSGQMDHWFGIMRAPVAFSGGSLVASDVLAKTAELAAGASGSVSVTLAPGSYELVCLMPGHYAAGQREAFTVTG
jgi:uncharacterized cupredoxin-like copper-binding protein